MHHKLSILIVAASLAGLALLASACAGDTTITSSTTTISGITVDGTGRAYGAPDTVLLQLGVTLERTTVADARQAAASAMASVIESLKRNGVEEKNIQTTQLSIQPQYDFATRVQTLRGYRVTNVVNAKVTKIDTASKVIDDAAAAGGNAVILQSISFSIDDPSKLQQQAREQAVSKAKEAAQQLARNAGVSLGKIQSISENVQRGFPIPATGGLALERSADTATPIQTGELEIIVNVNLLYAID